MPGEGEKKLPTPRLTPRSQETAGKKLPTPRTTPRTTSQGNADGEKKGEGRRLSQIDATSKSADESVGLAYQTILQKAAALDAGEAPDALKKAAADGSPLLSKLVPVWGLDITESEDARTAMGVSEEQAGKMAEILKCKTLGQLAFLYGECNMDELSTYLRNELFTVFGKNDKDSTSAVAGFEIQMKMLNGDTEWRSQQLSVIRRSVRRHRFGLQNILKEFDHNGDGFVSNKEFRKALKSVGVALSPAVLAELYHGMTYGKEDSMSVQDFMDHAGIEPYERALTVSRQERTFLERFLKEEDWSNSKASISKERFDALCSKYGVQLHGYLKTQMLDLFDANKDGKVGERELILGILMLLGGGEQDRVELLYDLIDANQDGEIDKKELTIVMGTLSNDWVTDEGMAEFREKRDAVFDEVDGNKDGSIDKAEFKELLKRLPELNDIIQIKPHDQDQEVQAAGGTVNFVPIRRDNALAMYHLDKLTKAVKDREGLCWMHQTLCDVKIRVEYGKTVQPPRAGNFDLEYWLNTKVDEDIVPRDVDYNCEVLNRYAAVEFMHRSLPDQSLGKVKEMLTTFAKRYEGMPDFFPLNSLNEMYGLVNNEGKLDFDSLRALAVMEMKGNPAQKAEFLYSLVQPKSRQSVIKELGAVVKKDDFLKVLSKMNKAVLKSIGDVAAGPLTATQVEESSAPDAFASYVNFKNMDQPLSWSDFVGMLDTNQWLWELFIFNRAPLEKGKSSSSLTGCGAIVRKGSTAT